MMKKMEINYKDKSKLNMKYEYNYFLNIEYCINIYFILILIQFKIYFK